MNEKAELIVIEQNKIASELGKNQSEEQKSNSDHAVVSQNQDGTATSKEINDSNLEQNGESKVEANGVAKEDFDQTNGSIMTSAGKKLHKYLKTPEESSHGQNEDQEAESEQKDQLESKEKV